MDNVLASNLKFLRKKKNITQDELSSVVSVTRAVIGSYEEGRAVPKLNVLTALADYFQISVDELIRDDLSGSAPKTGLRGQGLRVLTAVVDKENSEQIVLVPHKATAGYTAGYADPEYVAGLPSFRLPLPELGRERTYRAFQIVGDSMLPVPSGAYIIAEYVPVFSSIPEATCCIVITRDDGIVYKRVYTVDDEVVMLKSDNPVYKPYTVKLSAVSEIWRALGYISMKLPEPETGGIGELSRMMQEMKDQINKLHQPNSNIE
jgi:transcriptional regulator with XRE-family HTH domain